MNKDKKVTQKNAKNSKYKELNDSELEIICGGTAISAHFNSMALPANDKIA